jgi:peptide/nickel transport system permease protein
MATLIVRRLLQTIVVLFFVTVLVFMIMQLLPGDPARIMLGLDASEEQIEQFRKEMGLDKPIPVQYMTWLGGVITGDLGRSIVQRNDVSQMILSRLPVTLQLGVYAIAMALIISIPAGIIAAVKRGTAIDSVIVFLCNTGLSVPNFWLAILAVYLFSMTLGWLPVHGYVPLGEDVVGHLKHIFLPALILSTNSLAALTRQTRSAMLEVIRQDYIRTARSKGLAEKYILMKHAFRNALIPIITVLGLALSSTIGYTVLIETVFNIPGMSRLLVNSLFSQDYPVVQGCVLIIGIIVSVINLVVDMMYRYVDPRVRFD